MNRLFLGLVLHGYGVKQKHFYEPAIAPLADDNGNSAAHEAAARSATA